MSNLSVKDIKDINIGDYIISHSLNQNKVIDKFSIHLTGNISKFNINNSIPLICKDPNFFRLNISNPNWKISTSPFRIFNEEHTIKTLLFTNNGFLLSPVISKTINSDLNENKARLLGLFAAEGSFHKVNNAYRNEVIFTFSNKEYNSLAILTKNLLESEFDTNVSIITKHNKTTVIAYKQDIYKFFLYHCNEYSYLKCLSEDLVFSSNNIIKQFILGWLEGDGHIQSDNRITGTTTSPSLASQIRFMLYKLNIHNSLYLQPPSKSFDKTTNRYIIGNHPIYRLRINATNASKIISNSNKLSLRTDIKAKEMNKFYNNYCLHNILKEEILPYDGQLFGLKVENDKSFVANYMIIGE